MIPSVISSDDKELLKDIDALYYENRNYRLKPSTSLLRKLFLKRILRQKKKKLKHESYRKQKLEAEKLKDRSLVDYDLEFSVYSYERKKYEDVRQVIETKIPKFKKAMHKAAGTDIKPFASVYLKRLQ